MHNVTIITYNTQTGGIVLVTNPNVILPQVFSPVISSGPNTGLPVPPSPPSRYAMKCPIQVSKQPTSYQSYPKILCPPPARYSRPLGYLKVPSRYPLVPCQCLPQMHPRSILHVFMPSLQRYLIFSPFHPIHLVVSTEVISTNKPNQ